MSKDNQSTTMKREDVGLSINLAGLFSIRMLGIFLILPIYAQYMREEFNSSGLMTGLFISSYALTQLIMQPIVGALSDKIGRKPAIIGGLILFICGSLLIAFSNGPVMAIIGRVIQGSGAISSVILALTSDVVREEIRGRVMAIIGIGIGVTFGVSIVLSNIVYALFNGTGIFITCALLGIAAIFVTIYQLPNPDIEKKESLDSVNDDLSADNTGMITSSDSVVGEFFTSFKQAFRFSDVNRLYVGALVLHLVLTGAFTTFSVFLSVHGYETKQLRGPWTIYLPSFFISLFIMFGVVGYAERFYRHRLAFLLAIALLAISFIPMLFNLSYFGLVGAMLLFFIGFNVMEASQPSLMSRLAPQKERGMFMGVFSSAQFIGASIGGMAGSLLYEGSKLVFDDPSMSYKSVFLFLMVVLIGWFIYAYPMKDLVKPDSKSEAKDDQVNNKKVADDYNYAEEKA